MKFTINPNPIEVHLIRHTSINRNVGRDGGRRQISEYRFPCFISICQILTGLKILLGPFPTLPINLDPLWQPLNPSDLKNRSRIGWIKVGKILLKVDHPRTRQGIRCT